MGKSKTPSTSEPSTVIYDDRCRLCVTAKEGIEKLAQGGGLTHVRFLPYASEEAARYLGQEYTPGRPEVAFSVSPNGNIRKGLEAFLPLLPGIRGGRLLLFLARLPLFRPVLDLAYRIMARHRYRWFGEVRRPPS